MFGKINAILFPPISIDYQNSKKYIPELDGIRGLAILFVVFFHMFRFSFGWSGVDLFFVLSGFLITGILLDTKDEKYYFRNFWIRRTLRIFPLYYLVLVLILLPKLMFKINTIGEPSITYWFYIDNWKFVLDGGFPTGKAPISHFWSLAIEEQFYLIFPLIIRFSKPKLLYRILLFFVLSSILFRFYFFYNNNIGYYVFTFSRIDALSIGALLAYLVRNNKKIITKWIHFVFYFSLLYVLFVILKTGNLHFSNYYFATFGYTIIALLFSAILIYSISSFSNNYISIFFNLKILQFLGKIAYGLYIYHWIFYFYLKPYIEIFILKIIGNVFISKSINSVFILLFTVFISYLSYHFFEKKFLLYKDKFSK